MSIHKSISKAIRLSVVGAILPTATLAAEFEVSGKVGVEQRYFTEEGAYSEQLSHGQSSIYIEPELYWSWNNGNDSITFKPFYRKDQHDDERSHGDIRELSYIHASDNWEIRAGIRKEFWGVTEFQHVVDVINQTDTVEDFDGEDKLGQLMLNLSVVKDYGIFDVYILPGFRERTFVGKEGRLRGALVVDPEHVKYESSEEDEHIDVALRWSHSIGVFDVGSYWFHGTNREPILMPVQQGNQFVLQQYYSQMDQFGFDAQATVDDWLWKFETIYRSTELDDFWAAQAGFEYSFIGVLDSNTDLGVLIEYGWDSRGEGDSLTPSAPIQNDLFFGNRLAFNDMQSTEVLWGVGADLDHNAYSFVLEANRRFGENFKASVDARLFQSTSTEDLLYSIKDDDHLQLSIEYYF